eukprot:8341223-Prorocentrum_lima.AAC.1
MQVTYPFRTWIVDVKLWDYSTSVDVERRGPLLVSQLQATAKMHMQTDLDADPDVALLFQFGGLCIYDNGATSLEGSGLQHILFRLGKYIQEH